MPTRGFRPGENIVITANAGDTPDHYGIKAAQQGGRWPNRLEVQVLPLPGNTAFSVTVEHTLDPAQTAGWSTIATLTTSVPSFMEMTGGWYRFRAGTATGGPVQILAACA